MNASAMFVSREEQEDRLRMVKTLAAEGYSPDDIAASMKLSKRTVERYRKALGLTKPNRHLTVEELRMVELFLEDECPLREIARTLGCSYAALEKRFPGRSKAKGNPLNRRESRVALNLGVEIIPRGGEAW